MSTFAAGDRVKVQDTYGQGHDDDGTFDEVRGVEGTVKGHRGPFIEVKLDNGATGWLFNYLFTAEELIKL